jgi:hypothetical protein
MPAPLSESSKSQMSNTEITSETLVNEAEFEAEFTDDEIDADVCSLKIAFEVVIINVLL